MLGYSKLVRHRPEQGVKLLALMQPMAVTSPQKERRVELLSLPLIQL